MKQAYRHQPTVAKSAKKARPARTAKPNAVVRKDAALSSAKRFKAPIFNGPLAGTSSHYIRPFDPVWPTEETD